MTTENLNIQEQKILITPNEIKKKYSIDKNAEQFVANSRSSVKKIMNAEDNRLLVIVGPCSIHDYKAAIEYAHKLKELSDEVSSKIFVIMRVYFEKPRTTIGWKGLINDPNLDGTADIQKGILIARKLLLELTNIGLPCGTEALDPVMPQYLGDLISWTAIGARTSESQTHREMSSGLSTPIGFKNGTDGNLETAVNAILSASKPHSFLGIDSNGQVAVTKTKGNDSTHLVLRGGSNGPNYFQENINESKKILKNVNLSPNLIIDCSHANSNKNYKLQSEVFEYCLNLKLSGESAIKGLMLESNLVEGNQSLGDSSADLVFGKSITDSCINWDTTSQIIKNAFKNL
jgi:3-deoxy-7-phosphoheptulonate synthase